MLQSSIWALASNLWCSQIAWMILCKSSKTRRTPTPNRQREVDASEGRVLWVRTYHVWPLSLSTWECRLPEVHTISWILRAWCIGHVWAYHAQFFSLPVKKVKRQRHETKLWYPAENAASSASGIDGRDVAGTVFVSGVKPSSTMNRKVDGFVGGRLEWEWRVTHRQKNKPRSG